jgi:hypothetical protein
MRNYLAAILLLFSAFIVITPEIVRTGLEKYAGMPE